MKRALIISVIAIVIFAGCTKKQTVTLDFPVIITDSSAEKQMTFDELIENLKGSNLISVGEIHTDSLTHVIEKKILKSVYSGNRNITVALEMFERDVQKYLDDYLSGKIDEETFLKNSRPWNNYKTAYRPLIEFAKNNNLAVLAMNVPRRYAAIVARKGGEGLSTIPDSEKVWIAKNLKALDDEYRKRFVELMTGGDKPMPMKHMNPQKMYEAQCLKDDTMAESIVSYLTEHPEKTVFTCEGSFHSNYRLGFIKKVLLLEPELKVSVISVVPVKDLQNIKFEEHKGLGDFIIFVKGESAR
ncbi:hypothetical protein DRQ07_01360 [candidate division KSB1 bacterium]|nr:MAG: hypothetical protein DRQ07_01360 [candidate division KSB1 bacterium]